ncbi:MAG: DUF5666 domain-containing protein [Cellvibrionaceae bacterium]
MSQLIKYSIYILVSLSLIACGGGGGQDGTGRPPSNERQVTSVGTITSDDTLTVNGVEYDTSNATVIIDNESATEDELELGQIVVINGTLDESGDTGTAESIAFNTNVLGPVSSITPTDNIELNNSFVVLGQTINVTPETIYAGSRFENPEMPIENSSDGFDNINVGDHLRIVGFISAEGELVASYIESITIPAGEMPGEGDNPFYEVNGPISNLDITARTFNVNDLVVDYSDLINVEQLENGILAEVLGSSLGNGGELLANSVVVLSEEIAEVDTRLELEGFITVFDSAQSFEINGLRIESDINTEIVGGTVENIALNKRIEVEGDIDGDGILVAERIIILASYLTSHRYGERLESRSTTFSWANVNADEYRLTILGEGNVFFDQNFDSQTFSVNVDDLPFSGAPLAVTLYTRQGDLWIAEFYYLLALNYEYNYAELVSHASGDTLNSDDIVFEWTNVNADEYRLTIENNSTYSYDEIYSEFHNEIYNGSITSAVVNDLPDSGLPLRVMLATRFGDTWSTQQYMLTSSGEAQVGAEILSHRDGDALISDAISFSWSDVGAYRYHIIIESGSSFIAEYSVDSSDLSRVIESLPSNSADIRIRLVTVWPDGSSYQNQVDLIGSSGLPGAQLLNYSNGDVLESGSINFQWTDVGADSYRLQVYNTEGSNRFSDELLFDNTLSSRNHTINHLPIDGRELRVVLSTRHGRHGSGWSSQEYFLTSATLPLQAPELTSHEDGNTLGAPSGWFTWSNVNADRYQLIITQVDGTLVLDRTFARDTRTALLSGFPRRGQPLIVRLISQHNSIYNETITNLISWSRPEYLIEGGNENDVLEGGVDDDSLSGLGGNDVITGGGGDDQIFGGVGNDELSGGDGNDSLYGGVGDDIYYINLNEGNTVIFEDTQSRFTSAGDDTILFGFGIAPNDLSLMRITSNFSSGPLSFFSDLLITVESTGQTILIVGFYAFINEYGLIPSSIRRIETFQFADGTIWDLDTILTNTVNTSASEMDDYLTLPNFGSTVEAGGGNDDILGGDGNDIIDGGSGDDFILAWHGDDRISTGTGNDEIIGGRGDDIIIINSMLGDHTTISGGQGNDTYRYKMNAGNVLIDDYRFRGFFVFNDIEQLYLDDGITPLDISLSRNERNDILITILNTGSVITIEFGYASGRRRGQIDSIVFSDGTEWDALTFSSMAVPINE